jgi:hypothetical protein
MTAGRYLEGLLVMAVALVPVGLAAHTWRRRLLPGWSGPEALLAEIVMAGTVVLLAAEALGLVWLLRLWALVPVLAAVGTVGYYVGCRGPGTAKPDGRSAPAEGAVDVGEYRPPPVKLPAAMAAVVAVGLLAADWSSRTVDSLHHGMTSTDTLWYHLPFAARFAQQGTVVPLHYVDSEAVTVFFPASSELVHALGIEFLGSDLLSPLINLGWVALALLAAWCIGRPFGVAPASLTGVVMLLVTPGLVATQPGGGYDDIVGLALVLACAALLVTASCRGGPTRPTGQAVAALAAGLALGTKFTFVAPVGALTVGIWVLARRGRRWSEGGLWLLLVVLTGGIWYFRNLFTVGNPLPSLHLALGPLALPSPTTKTPTSTVSHFLFNAGAWHHYLLPGLRLSFGPAWWAVLGLAGAGLVLGVLSAPGRVPRMLAWVGIVSGAAFLVTPQYLTILGAPVYFVDNVRYGDPALVLGLVLLPLAPVFAHRGRWRWLLGGELVVIGATQLDGTVWPIDVLAQRFGYPIGGVDSLIGLGCGAVVLVVGTTLVLARHSLPGRARSRRAVVTVAVAVAVAVAVVPGLALQQFYLRNRYAGPGTPLPLLERDASNARVAVAGGFGQLQYGFYGRDLSNFVQYVGQTEPHHGFGLIDSCPRWRQILDQGHYTYVVITTGLVANRADLTEHPPRYTVWTETDTAAQLVRRQVTTVRDAKVVGYWLFRIRGPLDPASCPRSGQGT